MAHAESDPWKVALANAGLARRAARRLEGRGLDRDDLIQEGLIALRWAAIEYDPARGYPWPIWATLVVRRLLGRAVRRCGRWSGRSRGLDGAPEPAAPGPDGGLDDDERRRILAALGRLGERERRVVRLRHGLDGDAPKAYREIGAALGFSEQRAHFLAGAALAKLASGPLRTMAAP